MATSTGWVWVYGWICLCGWPMHTHTHTHTYIHTQYPTWPVKVVFHVTTGGQASHLTTGMGILPDPGQVSHLTRGSGYPICLGGGYPTWGSSYASPIPWCIWWCHLPYPPPWTNTRLWKHYLSQLLLWVVKQNTLSVWGWLIYKCKQGCPFQCNPKSEEQWDGTCKPTFNTMNRISYLVFRMRLARKSIMKSLSLLDPNMKRTKKLKLNEDSRGRCYWRTEWVNLYIQLQRYYFKTRF